MRFDILLSRSKGDWFERMFREEFAEAMVMDLFSSNTMNLLKNGNQGDLIGNFVGKYGGLDLEIGV